MLWFGRKREQLEEKAEPAVSGIAAPEQWLIDLLGGGTGTEAGENIGPETAMRVPAVLAATRAISATLASLPVQVFRRGPDDSRERDRDHPAAKCLDQPNPWAGGYAFRLRLISDAIKHGRGLAVASRGGTRIELHNVQPGAMSVETTTFTKQEIDTLRLRWINGVDFTSRHRKAARKDRDRDRKRIERQADPAHRPQAQSATRLKPWLAAGFKTRRTWERHRAKANVATLSATIPRPERVDVATSSRQVPTVLLTGSKLRQGSQPAPVPYLFAVPPSRAPAEILARFAGGLMPEPIIVALADLKARLGMTWAAVAREVRLSREQLANARARRFGLSPSAATSVRQLLEAA